MIINIRSRLTVIVILLTMLPLVGLSIFVGWQSFATGRIHAEEMVRATARRVGTEVSSSLAIIISHLQVLVRIRGLADIAPENRKDILEELLSFHQEFESVSYLNDKGIELLKVSRTEPTRATGADRSSSDEFLLPATSHTTFYGPVVFSSASGEPIMEIAEPLLDPATKTTQGILVATVRLKKIWGVIANLTLHPGENVYIIDSVGRVVAHRNPSVVLRGTRTAIPGLVFPSAGAANPPLGLENKPVIYASHRISLGERNLDVIAERSIAEAYRPARIQARVLFVATLLTLVIAVFVIVIVTGTIVRPVQHLAAVARDIMHGKLDSQAQVGGNDELAELAATFNLMTEQLRSSLQELRQELRINESLSNLSNKLLLTADIREIARLVLETARELTGSNQGMISLMDRKTPGGRSLLFEITVPACTTAKTNPFSGHRATRLPAFFSNTGDNSTLPADHPDLSRFLAVPVCVGEEHVGRIVLAETARDYRETDLEVVKRLAALYALTVSRFWTMDEKETLESALRQAQKMEAIGTLAGGIAHDFNNILTPILGYAELIQATSAKDSATGRDIGEIIRATKRAIDLVGQILTFSRRKEHKRQSIFLQPIIKESLKLLRATIPTSIDIRHRIDPSCGAVLADPTQIHQIIMNLCTNAFHAMEEKGGTLAVSLEPLTLQGSDLSAKPAIAPGDYVRLEVSDTGTGMKKEVLDRIFEPYYSTKAEGKGTGLGLSVVLGIVKAHGGEITVYSEPGQGTTFHVYLPVAVIHPFSAPESNGNNLSPLVGGEHILLVDDEAVVLNLEKKILIGLGYQVDASSDSEEALRIFLANPDAFHLLITDMTMPKLSGAELAKMVLARRPDLPIIICTGYSELITAEKAKEIGIREYISKPITLQHFAATVRTVLDRQQKQGPPPASRSNKHELMEKR
ncbi:MAG: ATP-binding protein [Thermodesulfobacteriota bacterium]